MGELKAVLVAVKEKTKTICVDSYTPWAGATLVVSLHWQGKGKEAWQKEDGKWLVLQAQSHGQIHTGWPRAHGNDQTLQTYWNNKVDQLTKIRKIKTDQSEAPQHWYGLGEWLH